jgi:hypothetical protein
VATPTPKPRPYHIKHPRTVVRNKKVAVVATNKKPSRHGVVSAKRVSRPVQQKSASAKSRQTRARRTLERPQPPKSNNIVKSARNNRRDIVINQNQNAIVAGRPSRGQRMTRKGRGNLQNSIRSVRHQRNLREHANKLKEMRNRGRGRVLVMVACGPSLNEIPVEQLKGNPLIDIMSINKPDQRLWPTTYWAFCDKSQYDRNKELWAPYQGIIFNSAGIRVTHPKQLLIRTRSGKGFSRDVTNGFHIGRSTTYANMQTALHLGYDRIYILGCDMGSVNGRLHYYGKNPDVSDKNRIDRFAREAENYSFAAGHLSEAEKKKFYFCSDYNKWPFVKQFNTMSHHNAISHIMEYVKVLQKR